ncbi:MAG: ClC family H(+)/Cl(-) exchange transporter [Clostridia bacterium]|nr:ClC family H(+)/Cl(-) exchange transporter [Clostridia bacterium]
MTWERKHISLIGKSLLVGAFAALSAVAYRAVLGRAEALCHGIFGFADSPLRIVLLFLFLFLMGLVVGRITESEPFIKGSGIPQLEGQFHGHFSPKPLAVLVKKFVGGALSIVCGLSLGREGPSIQLGAMTGQLVSSRLPEGEEEDSKLLLLCGACAGLAAAFNAPLAGVAFALEETYKKITPKVVFATAAASIFADIVSKLFFGTTPALNLPQVDPLPLSLFYVYPIVGLCCGCLGVLFNKTLMSTQRLYKKLPLRDTCRIAIPFLFAGVFGLVLPEVLGGGHHIITHLSGVGMTVGMMLLLLAAKFAFTMICFCSGAPGGIFFPLLVLGALSGGIIGSGACALLGLPESCMINFLLLGMTGMFSGIVRAPITGIILVAEMSGSLTQFTGLVLVSVVASLTANMLGCKPVYDELLENMLRDRARTH